MRGKKEEWSALKFKFRSISSPRSPFRRGKAGGAVTFPENIPKVAAEAQKEE